MCFKLPDRGWTKARNLGATVNAARLEFCPSVSRNRQYLFFTSRRSKKLKNPRFRKAAHEALGLAPDPVRGDIDIYWPESRLSPSFLTIFVLLADPSQMPAGVQNPGFESDLASFWRRCIIKEGKLRLCLGSGVRELKSEDDVALTTPRQHPRVVPTSPLTVAIEDDTGLRMGYGVITNVSLGGACVFTDGRFPEGSRLRLRLSFCQPSEVHEVSGVVVWERSGERNRDTPTRRFGVEWRETPPACKQRLRELVCDAEEETLAPSSLIALRCDLIEH